MTICIQIRALKKAVEDSSKAALGAISGVNRSVKVVRGEVKGVRGAVDSGNHKIVAAFGGKLAFNSRVHGDQWATDTQGQTARGFMTSDGGAYEWSVHHVQAPQLHGGRSNAVSASGKKEADAVVEAAVAAASAAAADL